MAAIAVAASVLAVAASIHAQQPVTSARERPAAAGDAARWIAALEQPGKQLEAVREIVRLGPAALPAVHKALATARPDTAALVLFACSGLQGDVESLREPIRRHLRGSDLGTALAARDAWLALDGGGRTLVADFHVPAVLTIDAAGEVTQLVKERCIRASALPDGHVLVVGYDTKRVFEVDAVGAEVWSCGGFDTPHDAERLPDGSTLVADPGGRRVVEVDRDGKETWTFTGDLRPLDADRLGNGNTLIASYRTGVVEVDRAGKVVWQWANTNARDADRLPDGTTLVTCTDEQRVVRVAANGDRAGEWRLDFRVNTAQLLPNGRLLAGGDGAVVELDGDGREVWRVAVKHATSVARLGVRREAAGGR